MKGNSKNRNRILLYGMREIEQKGHNSNLTSMKAIL